MQPFTRGSNGKSGQIYFFDSKSAPFWATAVGLAFVVAVGLLISTSPAQAAGLATNALPQRHQLNLRTPRCLKIEPTNAVRVGDGVVENGHFQALEGR